MHSSTSPWPLLSWLVASPPRPEFWPPTANLARADVLCDGTSLAALAVRDGTPTVHVSESPDAKVAVLVARVIATDRHSSGTDILLLDARLDNLRLVWSEARVISRDPGRRRRMILVARCAGRDDLARTEDALALELPADIDTGDLIAIPSRPLNRLSRLSPLTGRLDGQPDSIFGDRRRVS